MKVYVAFGNLEFSGFCFVQLESGSVELDGQALPQDSVVNNLKLRLTPHLQPPLTLL